MFVDQHDIVLSPSNSPWALLLCPPPFSPILIPHILLSFVTKVLLSWLWLALFFLTSLSCSGDPQSKPVPLCSATWKRRALERGIVCVNAIAYLAARFYGTRFPTCHWCAFFSEGTLLYVHTVWVARRQLFFSLTPSSSYNHCRPYDSCSFVRSGTCWNIPHSPSEGGWSYGYGLGFRTYRHMYLWRLFLDVAIVIDEMTWFHRSCFGLSWVFSMYAELWFSWCLFFFVNPWDMGSPDMWADNHCFVDAWSVFQLLLSYFLWFSMSTVRTIFELSTQNSVTSYPDENARSCSYFISHRQLGCDTTWLLRRLILRLPVRPFSSEGRTNSFTLWICVGRWYLYRYLRQGDEIWSDRLSSQLCTPTNIFNSSLCHTCLSIFVLSVWTLFAPELLCYCMDCLFAWST